MHQTIALDETDRKLLRLLQADAALTTVDLADRIGLSQSQVSRRQKRLEAAGVIKGYRAALDPRLMGVGATLFVRVALTAQNAELAERFKRLVATIPEITEVYATTGPNDFLLKVMVENLDAMSELIDSRLVKSGLLARIESDVVLSEVKHAGHAVPV